MARQRGTGWEATVYQGDRRVRRLFRTEAEALAFEAGDNSNTRPCVAPLFREAYEHLWANTRDKVNAYRITEELIGLIGEGKRPPDVSTLVVRELVTKWRAKGNTDKTINRKLSKLSMLMKYSKAHYPDLVMPETKRFKEAVGRVRYLDRDEAYALIGAFTNDLYRRFATFLLYTGCRYSEAVNLKWPDINSNGVTFWETKGGKPRTIPLVKAARDALVRQGAKPWPIHYDAFHNAFHKAKEDCGLGEDDEIVIHTLRHTCASWLVQQGTDLRRVKDWMGHAQITTTMIYAHLAPGDLQSAAEALETAAPRVAKHVSDVAGQTGHSRGKTLENQCGGVPEWLKGTDCKSPDTST